MRRLLLCSAVMMLSGCAAGEVSSVTPTEQESRSVVVTTPTITPRPTPKRVQPTRPTAFKLWKFNAPVVPVQLEGSALVPPPDPKVLGWWGQKAGARHGTTLLFGHTVHAAAWKTYGHGELDDLELTPVGSTARVSGVNYQVDTVEVITQAALKRRAPKLFDQGGRPKLVVVTCEGYDPSTGEYSDNVVVVAHRR